MAYMMKVTPVLTFREWLKLSLFWQGLSSGSTEFHWSTSITQNLIFLHWNLKTRKNVSIFIYKQTI